MNPLLGRASSFLMGGSGVSPLARAMGNISNQSRGLLGPFGPGGGSLGPPTPDRSQYKPKESPDQMFLSSLMSLPGGPDKLLKTLGRSTKKGGRGLKRKDYAGHELEILRGLILGEDEGIRILDTLTREKDRGRKNPYFTTEGIGNPSPFVENALEPEEGEAIYMDELTGEWQPYTSSTTDATPFPASHANVNETMGQSEGYLAGLDNWRAAFLERNTAAATPTGQDTALVPQTPESPSESLAQGTMGPLPPADFQMPATTPLYGAMTQVAPFQQSGGLSAIGEQFNQSAPAATTGTAGNALNVLAQVSPGTQVFDQERQNVADSQSAVSALQQSTGAAAAPSPTQGNTAATTATGAGTAATAATAGVEGQGAAIAALARELTAGLGLGSQEAGPGPDGATPSMQPTMDPMTGEVTGPTIGDFYTGALNRGLQDFVSMYDEAGNILPPDQRPESTTSDFDKLILNSILGNSEITPQDLFPQYQQPLDPTQRTTGVESAMAQVLSGQPVGGPVTAPDLSPERTAEYFQTALTDPMMRTFEEEISPRIQEGFSGAGAGFSSRKGDANRRALESMQSSLSAQLAQAQLSNMQLDARLDIEAQRLTAEIANQGAQRQLQGLPSALALENLPLNQTLAMFGAGGQLQGLDQAALDREYQDFLRMQGADDPFLTLGANITGQSQTAVEEGGPSLASELLGTGIGLAASGGFSGLGSLFAGGGAATSGGLPGSVAGGGNVPPLFGF